jgi:uncharacterized protein (DUF362 family)
VAGVAGAAKTLPLPQAAKSRVVISRDPKVLESGPNPDSARLMQMLDRAMQSLYNRDTPQEAWRRVVPRDAVVGIKPNAILGRGASPHPELIEAIAERVLQAGAREVIVCERRNQNLESSYPVSTRHGDISYFGLDSKEDGFADEPLLIGSYPHVADPKLPPSVEQPTVMRTVRLPLARLLTRTCDMVINVPMLKDHTFAGITGALKNVFGMIPTARDLHPDWIGTADTVHPITGHGSPRWDCIADFNMLPPIRAKVRLHIFDALTVQYEGGPPYRPQWVAPYNGLLVSQDPVALDYTAWQIIEGKRAEKGMGRLASVEREPNYIAIAADAKHRLGTNDPARIDRVEV